MRGKKGAGKGMYGQLLLSIWSSHALHISNAKYLIGNFNAHLSDTCFLFADEAFYANDKQHEGTLKTLVTERTLTIEPKGIDARQQKNYLKILMATNSEYAVPATGDERRFCVFDVSDKHIKDTEYFNNLVGDIQNPEVQAAFLAYMLDVSLKGWHSGQIPESRGLREQRYHTMDSVQKWLVHVLKCGGRERKVVFPCQSGGDEYVWEDIVPSADLYDHYVLWCDKIKSGEFRRSNDTVFGTYRGKVFGKSKMIAIDGAKLRRSYQLGTLEEAITKFEQHEKVVLSEI